MLFKAKFIKSIDESTIEIDDIEVDFNSVLNKEIIYYLNHEFEIERDDDGCISELTFCNQCIKTFDIEEVFISLIIQLLPHDETVILYDSTGSEEILTKNDLLEN